MPSNRPQRPAAAGPSPDRAAPWWRFGMVWLVLSGPAAVIVAGVATMVVAFHGADPPVSARGAGPTVHTVAAPTAPALQARNHVATSAR